MAFSDIVGYVLSALHLRHASAFSDLSLCVFPLRITYITVPIGLNVYWGELRLAVE